MTATENLTSPTFSELPPSVLRNCFSFLDRTDLIACAQTCKRIAAIIFLNDDLERMEQRSTNIVGRITPYPSQGPTEIELKNELEWLWKKPVDICLQNQINSASWLHEDNQINKQLVSEVIATENQHGGFTPIYHGMSLSVYLYSVFTRLLVSTCYPNTSSLPSNVPFIRFPNPQGPRTIQEFLEQHPPIRGTAYDHSPEIRNELLSTNPTIITNYQTPTESSWNYFLTDSNYAPPDRLTFFNQLNERYQLKSTPSQLQQLADLHEQIEQCVREYQVLSESLTSKPQRGILLQIMIPDHLVEKVCYACESLGYFEKPSTQSKKDKVNLSILQRFKDISKTGNADSFQVRFLIQSMFVPSHKIEVKAYGAGDFFSEAPPTHERFGPIFLRKKNLLEAARKIFFDMILAKSAQPFVHVPKDIRIKVENSPLMLDESTAVDGKSARLID